MAFTPVRARRATSLAPVGRLRLPRRATLARLVAVAALLLTAAAVLYTGGRDGSGNREARSPTVPSPTQQPGPRPATAPAPAPAPEDWPEPGSARWPQPSGADAVGPDAQPGRLPVPNGRVGVLVRLADPASLALLRPGDRVDLLSVATALPRPPEQTPPAPSPEQPPSAAPVELATGAIVLATDRPSGALLLAVTPAESRTVLAAPATAALAVLLPP